MSRLFELISEPRNLGLDRVERQVAKNVDSRSVTPWLDDLIKELNPKTKEASAIKGSFINTITRTKQTALLHEQTAKFLNLPGSNLGLSAAQAKKERRKIAKEVQPILKEAKAKKIRFTQKNNAAAAALKIKSIMAGDPTAHSKFTFEVISALCHGSGPAETKTKSPEAFQDPAASSTTSVTASPEISAKTGAVDSQVSSTSAILKALEEEQRRKAVDKVAKRGDEFVEKAEKKVAVR